MRQIVDLLEREEELIRDLQLQEERCKIDELFETLIMIATKKSLFSPFVVTSVRHPLIQSLVTLLLLHQFARLSLLPGLLYLS